MSTVIQPFINRLSEIKLDLSKIAKQIIIENSSEIVLLVKSQLSHGLNSDSNPLRWSGGNGYYSPHTQSYADRDNVQTPKKFGSAYNFSWSGETLDNLKMGKINKDNYEITTVKFKKDLLENIYGEIFDLTEENNNYVNNIILLPKLQEYIITESVRGLI
jgi:hypothetical protein